MTKSNLSMGTDLFAGSRKYFTTSEGLRSTLAQFGVAVIPSLVGYEKCLQIYDQVWKDLAYITQNWAHPISRDDASTWNLYNFSATKGMLVQHHKIAHLQSAWDTRQTPEIAEVFRILWQSEELLTSFDGIGISFPPEYSNRGWDQTTLPHTDQSYVPRPFVPFSLSDHSEPWIYDTGENGFQSVQSWFTPLIVRPGDATLVFLESSHVHHARFGKERGITELGNFYELSQTELDVYLSYGCTSGKIACPPGSLVLWDSRTIHRGAKPQRGRAEPNIRFVFYICMMPRSMAVDKYYRDLAEYQMRKARGGKGVGKPPENPFDKRRRLFEEQRVTTHHPIELEVFSKKPRVYSKEDQAKEPLLDPPMPTLTELGKRLLGL